MLKTAFICLLVIALCSPAWGAQLPTDQTVGASLKEFSLKKQKEKVTRQLSEPRAKVPALNAPEIDQLPHKSGAVYIEKIVFQGAALLMRHNEKKDIFGPLKAYENRRLSLAEMNKLAGEVAAIISDENVRVYIPQQSFSQKTLYINIIGREE